MYYLSWKFRKPYIEKAIDLFCNLMSNIFQDDDIAGWVVATFLHCYPYLIMLFSMLMCPLSNWMVMGFVITYISNYICHGCLCFRIERKLFNDRSWYGLYGIIEGFGMEVSTENVRKVFHVWTTIFALIMIYKYMRNDIDKNLIF